MVHSTRFIFLSFMIFMMGSEALQAATLMCPAIDTIKIEQVADGYRYTGTSTGYRSLIFSGIHPRMIPLTRIRLADVKELNGTWSLVCEYAGGRDVVELKSSDAGAMRDCIPNHGTPSFLCVY